MARVARATGQRTEAVKQFREAMRTFWKLAALAPDRPEWNTERQIISDELLQAERDIGIAPQA
jgi:hypothetical protein